MARYNLRIKCGTYTGTGALQNITDTGFRPQLVLTKGGANIACFRTRLMAAGQSAYFAGNTANFAQGINGFLDNGFQVGTDAKANANGTVYHYLAIWGAENQNYFRTFKYKGNGSDARQLGAQGIFFTPDLFFTKGDTAQNPCIRTVDVTGDNSWHPSGTADTTNEIQNFITNGVELGSSARVNSNGLEYFGFALKSLVGVIKTFTFTGDSVDDRNIIGQGFQPDFSLVKNGILTTAAVMKTSTMTANQAVSVGSSSPTTDLIQAFGSDGIQVGANTSVNASGNTIWGFSLKGGNYSVPIVRSAS